MQCTHIICNLYHSVTYITILLFFIHKNLDEETSTQTSYYTYILILILYLNYFI